MGTQYIAAIYWAVSVLSPGSDIVPETNTERMFASVTTLFACFVTALLISIMNSTMVHDRLLAQKVSRDIGELREFMAAKKVPKELRSKIKRYMSQLYQTKTGFNETEVL